eukprot:TRINITY_DN27425_c0_g1_i5.p1 TRINITY_DN27425_c0_g1~~TRINITY_DN27425_c0_g1_i5.p1  ORF type:complete len:101 (+),score=3.57 TRINITY_DN27425_c0_g1_i5:142-444(+)
MHARRVVSNIDYHSLSTQGMFVDVALLVSVALVGPRQKSLPVKEHKQADGICSGMCPFRALRSVLFLSWIDCVHRGDSCSLTARSDKSSDILQTAMTTAF